MSIITVKIYEDEFDDYAIGNLDITANYNIDDDQLNAEVKYTSHIKLNFVYKSTLDKLISELPILVQQIIKDDIESFLKLFEYCNDDNITFDESYTKCTIEKTITVLAKEYCILIICNRNDPIKKCEEYQKYINILHAKVEDLQSQLSDQSKVNNDHLKCIESNNRDIKIFEDSISKLKDEKRDLINTNERLLEHIESLKDTELIIKGLSDKIYDYSKVKRLEFKTNDEWWDRSYGRNALKKPYYNGYRSTEEANKESNYYKTMEETINSFAQVLDENEFIWYHQEFKTSQYMNREYHYRFWDIWITTKGKLLIAGSHIANKSGNNKGGILNSIELTDYNMCIPASCMDIINNIAYNNIKIWSNGKNITVDYCDIAIHRYTSYNGNTITLNEDIPSGLHEKFKNDIIRILEQYKKYIEVDKIIIPKHNNL